MLLKKPSFLHRAPEPPPGRRPSKGAVHEHGAVPLKLGEHPLVRMLVVIIAIAAGIRLTYELLKPAMPYLLAGLIVFAVIRIVSWYRNRW